MKGLFWAVGKFYFLSLLWLPGQTCVDESVWCSILSCNGKVKKHTKAPTTQIWSCRCPVKTLQWPHGACKEKFTFLHMEGKALQHLVVYSELVSLLPTLNFSSSEALCFLCRSLRTSVTPAWNIPTRSLPLSLDWFLFVLQAPVGKPPPSAPIWMKSSHYTLYIHIITCIICIHVAYLFISSSGQQLKARCITCPQNFVSHIPRTMPRTE